MTYLSTDLRNIMNVVEINDSEIAIQVSNPVFSLRNSYGVSFQPSITSYSSYSKENRSVIVFPLIPQYFHNFLEMFPKIINLKDQENFTVVLVYPGKKNEYGIFNSLIYGHKHAESNASHVKDFLDFIDVDYLCLSPEELESSRFSSAFLYYDDSNYDIADPSYLHKGKSYKLSHFLQVPKINILKNNVDLIRSIMPKNKPKNNLRLFVSRKKTIDRPYAYVEDLEESAKNIGYETTYFEDIRWLDQVKMVMDSSDILCQYGSALVNCMLMKSGSSIKAIKYIEGYDVYVYSEIFKYLGISYKEYYIDKDTVPSPDLLGKMV